MPPDTSPRPWVAPPLTRAPNGDMRRVGVEIEFGGLLALDAAQVVARIFGGDLRVHSDFLVDVTGARYGDFRVELDVKFAHAAVASETGRALRDAAAGLAAELIPVEVVCPPIPWDEAHVLDALTAELAAAGAEGGRAHALNAFGAQLNPELPSLEAADILRGLRAFLVLRDWLRAEIGVDIVRRLGRFAAAFPNRYLRRVLAADYAPDLPRLIDDYLADNATRNRELDALPLFAHLDEARVRAALPRETIAARPTWHYRLPNCDLDLPGWRLADDWARWVAVERLAEDRAALDRAMETWRALDAADAGAEDFEAAARTLGSRLRPAR